MTCKDCIHYLTCVKGFGDTSNDYICSGFTDRSNELFGISEQVGISDKLKGEKRRMTCKDCIHYECCSNNAVCETIYEVVGCEIVERNCNVFKYKSKIIEFPFAIEDEEDKKYIIGSAVEYFTNKYL